MCALVPGVQTCALPIGDLRRVAHDAGVQGGGIRHSGAGEAEGHGQNQGARGSAKQLLHLRCSCDLLFMSRRRPRSSSRRRSQAAYWDARTNRCCAATNNGEFLGGRQRSEEHTSELQSLMRISYAVFCLKKKTKEEATNMNLIK